MALDRKVGVNYYNKARGVSLTVYDIQGTPLSKDLIDKLTRLVELTVVQSGVDSLAINVSEG